MRRTASVVYRSPQKAISTLLTYYHNFFFIQIRSKFLFLVPENQGELRQTEIDKKNLGSCCKNVQHSKMILEQLWLSFENHIQLSRTLLYSSGKIKGWSMVLKRKEDIHHKHEDHKFISGFFFTGKYHPRYISLIDWFIDWLVDWNKTLLDIYSYATLVPACIPRFLFSENKVRKGRLFSRVL